jgi:phosphoribosylaminoimidazolecarboxamide formyltransferase/IMP cyclohydrolase
MDEETAQLINDLFFEVLIAPDYEEGALRILMSRRNRILLQLTDEPLPGYTQRTLLNGIVTQETDAVMQATWNEEGGRYSSDRERADMIFANIICKHLKSNAIAIVRDLQLIGKGCGQTSRIDALRHAIDKAKQFGFDLKGAVLASDAFFPFDDCVKLGYANGIHAFIQPGGSIRDADSKEYCVNNGLVMVLTGSRHFKH